MNWVDLGKDHCLSLGFPGSQLWDTDWKARAPFGIGFQETLVGNTGKRDREGKEACTFSGIFKPIITVGKWRWIPLRNPGSQKRNTLQSYAPQRKRELRYLYTNSHSSLAGTRIFSLLCWWTQETEVGWCVLKWWGSRKHGWDTYRNRYKLPLWNQTTRIQTSDSPTYLLCDLGQVT